MYLINIFCRRVSRLKWTPLVNLVALLARTLTPYPIACGTPSQNVGQPQSLLTDAGTKGPTVQDASLPPGSHFPGCADPRPEPSIPNPLADAPAWSKVMENTVFFTDETKPLSLYSNGAGTVRWQIVDRHGKTVGDETQSQVSGTHTIVQLPQLDPGYYTVSIRDETAAAKPVVSSVAVAVMERYALPKKPSAFGANTHPIPSTLMPVAARQGLSWARSDLTWQTLEGTAGNYDFSAFEDFYSGIVSSGVSWYALLAYNNTNYDSGNNIFSAPALTAWGNYVQKSLRHWPLISLVEVQNEPNLHGWSPASYAPLLAATYPAAKAVSPDIQVVAGGLYGADTDWPSQLLQDGGNASMDALSNHPYTYNQATAPEGIEAWETAVLSTMAAANGGQAKPLWISELGWPSARVDDKDISHYLPRSVLLALSAGARGYLYYDFIDDWNTDPTNSEQTFGMMRAPDAHTRVQPKPQFVTYATLIRNLTGAKFKLRGWLGAATTRMIFDTDTQVPLTVLYAPDGSRDVVAAASCPVVAIDSFGARKTLLPSNGAVTVPVSPWPTYVWGQLSSTAKPAYTTGFEPTDPSIGWSSTTDLDIGSNVSGYLPTLAGPELFVGAVGAGAHSGSSAVLYSGFANAQVNNFANLKFIDLNSLDITLGPAGQLSYWIRPQARSDADGGRITGDHSSYVLLDLIATDGTRLAEVGAVDQNGTAFTPQAQGEGGGLTLSQWNQVVVPLGKMAGKKLSRINFSFSRLGAYGGYRGFIDDVAIVP